MSALFFLAGCAAFACVPHLHKYHLQALLKSEPYFTSPVPVFSNRAMIRNDSSGKGAFGASRGNGKRKHLGIDLLVRAGQPIFSSKTGRVRYAGIGKGYGWYAEILHPDGRYTRYAHLERLSVSTGQWVLVGQKIGSAGKSGNADHPKMLPHLHFEIRENDKALDPLKGMMDPSLVIR